MRKYRFHTAPKQKRQYWGRFVRMKPEALRGVIRGWAVRERGLAPGAVKTRVRRTRLRLTVIYQRRFGIDAFAQQLSIARLLPQPGGAWLPRRFAPWRAGRVQRTS